MESELSSRIRPLNDESFECAATPSRSLYFESLGEDFERFIDPYDVDQRLALIFSHLLVDVQLKDRAVLEVGSGTGRITGHILSSGARLSVLDIGPRLVSDVVKFYHCQGIVGDAIRLPFSDGAFDAVISSECIEHTIDPLGAIEEMCRVCKVGGVVCLTTPNKLWYPALLLAQQVGLRKFSGIENWIFPHQAVKVMHGSNMIDIQLSGCHLWPFQFLGGGRRQEHSTAGESTLPPDDKLRSEGSQRPCMRNLECNAHWSSRATMNRATSCPFMKQ